MPRQKFAFLLVASVLVGPVAGCHSFTVSEWPSCLDEPDRCDQHVRISFRNQSGMETLVNFPAPVRFSADDIDYSRFASDGSDILFLDRDGNTTLVHDIEVWNPGGISLVWVKVPEIPANSDDMHIYLYQGDQRIDIPANPTAVWNDGYEGVYHFNFDPASGVILDSSGHERHGSIMGGGIEVTPSDADDTLGPTARLPGRLAGMTEPPSYIEIVGGEAFQSSEDTDKTVELWLHPDEGALPPRGYGLFDNRADYCQGFTVAVLDNGVTQANLHEAGGACPPDATSLVSSPTAGFDINGDLESIPPGRRYYIVAEARRPGPGEVQACLTMHEVSTELPSRSCGQTQVSEFSFLHNQPTWIGRDNSEAPEEDDRLLQGRIDELRISTGLRSQAWYDAQFAAAIGEFVVIEAD